MSLESEDRQSRKISKAVRLTVCIAQHMQTPSSLVLYGLTDLEVLFGPARGILKFVVSTTPC